MNIAVNPLSTDQKVRNFEDLDLERYHLTMREQEIVSWLCFGKTNWEISKILGISIHTVKVHVRSILKKMNVENRLQVVLTLVGSIH